MMKEVCDIGKFCACGKIGIITSIHSILRSVKHFSRVISNKSVFLCKSLSN